MALLRSIEKQFGSLSEGPQLEGIVVPEFQS